MFTFALPRQLRSLASHRRLRIVLGAIGMIALLVLAVRNAWPLVFDEFWQDEAATLLNYTAHGFFYPFTYYPAPNNHILFSAVLAAWRSSTDVDPALMRVLCLMFFLAALPVTVWAAYRMGGWLAAVIGGVLFASSTVAANFASQLRGYGMSWLFLALALLAATYVFQPQRRYWRLAYALAAAAAVAVLPTNLYLAGLIGGSFALVHWLQFREVRSTDWHGVAILVLAPLAGLLAYAAVWPELMRASELRLSSWTLPALLRHWGEATLAQYSLVALFALAGAAVVMVRLAGRRASAFDCAALLLMVGVPVALLLMPNVPFPRNLVTYLPVWYAALACLAALALREIAGHRHARVLGVIAVIAAGGWWAVTPAITCGTLANTRERYYADLCYQYYRQDYHPSRVAEYLQEGRIEGENSVVSDHEGTYDLTLARIPGIKVYEVHRDALALSRMPAGFTPIIVAGDRLQLAEITTALQLNAANYAEVLNTGFFKVYVAPKRRQPD